MDDGFYYLHTNGSLIHKRGLPGIENDLRDSTFVTAYWPVDTADRATAWRIAVEAGAAGAAPSRVAELATLWGLSNEDGVVYAERLGIVVEHYPAAGTWATFTLGTVPGEGGPSVDVFRPSMLESLTLLAKQLGYQPGANFADLVARSYQPVANIGMG